MKKFGVVQGGKRRKHIIDPRQSDLFASVETDRSELERITAIPIKTSAAVNLMPNYGVNDDVVNGINKGPLHIFRSTPPPISKHMTDNFHFLYLAFVGACNMEFQNGEYGIPHEMLISMSRAEFLANYFRAAVLKIRDAAEIEGYKPFMDLRLLSLDEVGEFSNDSVTRAIKEYHGLRELYNSEMSLHKVPLTERINNLPQEIKKKFLKSLTLQYRCINRATAEFPYAIRDFDPDRVANYQGIDIYRHAIAEFMRDVYRKNLKMLWQPKLAMDLLK